jgi:hypothetical protein
LCYYTLHRRFQILRVLLHAKQQIFFGIDKDLVETFWCPFHHVHHVQVLLVSFSFQRSCRFNQTFALKLCGPLVVSVRDGKVPIDSGLGGCFVAGIARGVQERIRKENIKVALDAILIKHLFRTRPYLNCFMTGNKCWFTVVSSHPNF